MSDTIPVQVEDAEALIPSHEFDAIDNIQSELDALNDQAGDEIVKVIFFTVNNFILIRNSTFGHHYFIYEIMIDLFCWINCD